MNKREFLSELGKRLSGLPRREVDDRLSFYGEMIDDRMEEGLSEEEAVARIGTVDEVASQIIAEIPLTKIVGERVRPKRRLRAWEIVLLVLGSPIWLSLLIALVAVILSLWVALWSVILSFWAVFVSFALGVPGGVVGGIGYLCLGHPLQGILLIGAGFFCAGVTIFLFFGCRVATVGAAKSAKRLGIWIKKRFAGKESAQ